MANATEELIKEVLDEIESALKDPRGIEFHQRRLAFLLSLGSVSLIEHHLKKMNVFKPGARINHLWLKKKKENAKKLIANQITCPVESLENLDSFLDAAYLLEKERNEMAYGKKFSENTIKKKIHMFLELKKRVENV